MSKMAKRLVSQALAGGGVAGFVTVMGIFWENQGSLDMAPLTLVYLRLSGVHFTEGTLN